MTLDDPAMRLVATWLNESELEALDATEPNYARIRVSGEEPAPRST